MMDSGEKKSDVLIIIPAYNEAQNIEHVVDELIEDYPELDYVVVTDGPTDGTDRICRDRGYNMVELKKNMGLSICFREGMKYAFQNGYRYAVQLDGDGQHRPEYVSRMREKAIEGYDIVMGSRFLRSDAPGGQVSPASHTEKSRMSPIRRLGSWLIRMTIYLKTGVMISDPTCGMRLYDRKIMESFVTHSGLSPEPDTIALLIKHGAKVAEVPVVVAERKAGSSYLDPIKAVRYMRRIIIGVLKIR